MKVLGAILVVILCISPYIGFTLLFNGLRRSAKKMAPRENADTVEFFVVPAMRILINSVLTCLVAFTVLTLLVVLSEGGDGWYAAFIPIAVFLAIHFTKPRSVIVNHQGIRQCRPITGDCEISWNEIAWMKRGVNSGSTYVKGKNGGRPVSFSPLLVGQSRFEREVQSHARDCNELDGE